MIVMPQVGEKEYFLLIRDISDVHGEIDKLTVNLVDRGKVRGQHLT